MTEEEPKAGDAFERWYSEPDARLPHNLNRVQIHGVGLKMRAKTTQHFWKLGEYVTHVENVMREEAYQVLDSIGYEPEYLQHIGRAYQRCVGMKRKDLPLGAYRLLADKSLSDEDRDLLAEKHDGLTREGFAELVKEYMVVNGIKAPTLTQGKRKNDDSKKTTKPDEVDELVSKGEALLLAMPQEEREEAISAYLESKSGAVKESFTTEGPTDIQPELKGGDRNDGDGRGLPGIPERATQAREGGVGPSASEGGGEGDADNPPESELYDFGTEAPLPEGGEIPFGWSLDEFREEWFALNGAHAVLQSEVDRLKGVLASYADKNQDVKLDALQRKFNELNEWVEGERYVGLEPVIWEWVGKVVEGTDMTRSEYVNGRLHYVKGEAERKANARKAGKR